jgi:glycosyltransferase involved in cell wall biosynthesis
MKKSKTQFTLSIVTPFLNEEDGLKVYFEKLIPELDKVTKVWEIICIDDGSTDDTLSGLMAFARRDKRIKVISFSRNFGKEAALTAGFDYAIGDAVIPIDADLQDPPELIEKLVKKWQEGYQIVDAVRQHRADSVFKKAAASLFHQLISFLTNGNIPAHVGDFRLIDRKALEAIKTMNEKTRYVKGVVPWVGFKRAQVKYARPVRKVGKTKFSFFKLFKLGCDAIFSFSSKPLKAWLYIGIMLSFISFIYACFLIGRTLMYGVDLPGYTSIMVTILFMGGIQLVSLGVIGEYIARIFKEVKNRPIYIVDETHGVKNSEKVRK